MDRELLNRLDHCLSGLAFPVSKEEVSGAVAEAPDALRRLVDAMPGLEFAFPSDVLSTARIAMEMGIERAWPEHAQARAEHVSDQTLAAEVKQRLTLCSQTNANLIRVQVREGRVYLDGRAADVPAAVMAARVAGGIAPRGEVVNRLHIQS